MKRNRIQEASSKLTEKKEFVENQKKEGRKVVSRKVLVLLVLFSRVQSSGCN